MWVLSLINKLILKILDSILSFIANLHFSTFGNCHLYIQLHSAQVIGVVRSVDTISRLAEF